MIGKDYLKVYIASPDSLDDPETFRRVYSEFPDFRKEKTGRYNNTAVRNQSAAAFGLLIHGLKKLGFQMTAPDIWNELGFAIGEHDKPYFANRPDICFSLSHTKGCVLCVISGVNCGCDIERIDRRTGTDELLRIAKRVFTDRERDSVTDAESFYRIWTRREAYVKYTGEGIAGMDPELDIESGGVCLQTVSMESHLISVCLPEDGYRIIREIKPEVVRL
ncbi:MAG: 4'-phosphopantetheinyl transferase superfamily protein [Lachnospiraceae bacterium]|nr:4'-phosphopantetheinyl transferase superfamily protein [Lachnospiraceae bacterium]